MGSSMADDFEAMWSGLAPLGRSATSGGYHRAPYTSVEAELRAWFVEQCAARGLEVESDGNGNLLAWWIVRDDPVVKSPDEQQERHGLPAVLVGSHLDSVPDGGAYDGPLGVVSSLAAIDRLRERGVSPRRPVVVGAFAEEEGSRFGLACLGSRLATGTTSPERARELTDRDGVRLQDAMDAAGLEPGLGRVGVGGPDRLLRGAARRAGPRPGRTATPPSDWPPGSGRTAATASTSPEPRTTPAPPGWRTGATRCSATR